MSAIPPNSIASVLQSGATQRTQSKIDDADRNARARAARQAAGRDDAVLEVEAADDDTQVHADAEGAGGSGRNTREQSADQEETETIADALASTDDGTAHLDLTA